ncbi:response regulator transcription factor [Tessaracoccus sp. MC1865]|uniref:LytR/AlgR family response regulator transcription factor n=1 Tax=Tessaracoccus sp. MC1865 TaxID=2760310 RepID=UPI0016012004|nr:LytTR family DNA-binding domain-containing protein [Tessaracoccus sp. MC1865]MBB1482579.1 response regulator transcription factor [Tessaracoccus sp. MC1865]QTO37968.1 response regulator transcription factor [Tessaracoccus sp. MC1865]
MITIGVVDDQPESRHLLQGYLAQYEFESGVQFKVEEFADGSELTASYRPRFDIIFLDVQMDNLDGFATARLIREVDPGVILIFVTNMAQFAIKGYEVDALSYLLKPVPYFAFSQELKRSLERLDKARDEHIMLGVGGEMLRVDLADVIYIESIKHRLVFHMVDEKLSMIGTLKEMATQLEPRGFYRSNSFLLVNLRHVEGFSGSESKHTGGVSLPVSRARKKPFLEALSAYFGGNPA